MDMNQLWQQFFIHLRVRRRSMATQRYYACSQRVFGRFLDARKISSPAEEITVHHLRDFLMWLEEEGLAPGGVHGHARAMRSLFNWAAREEVLEASPARRLELPSLPRVRLPTVTVDTVKRLLKTVKASERPLRDTAIVMTLFDTGVRIQELVSLQEEDLLLDRGLLRVMGKGRKQRFVPIGSSTMHAVNAYFRRERRPEHRGVHAVFLNRVGQPLTPSGVGIRLTRLGRASGVARADCAPHAFRRGFAVEFLRNGGDVFSLQQIMGHASLDMTRRYVSFLDEDLKAAHLRFSPGDRL